jgi:hypothetical protein
VDCLSSLRTRQAPLEKASRHPPKPRPALPLKGTRRYGSEEAPPIDWLVPPNRRPNAHSDAALTEIFAYHAVRLLTKPIRGAAPAFAARAFHR